MKKGRELDKLAASPLKAAEGLSPHEMVCLAVVMENTLTPSAVVSAGKIARDMNRAGFTTLAASLSLRALLRKRMLDAEQSSDDDGEPITLYRITEEGQEWLLANQDKLSLRFEPAPAGDDIPF